MSNGERRRAIVGDEANSGNRELLFLVSVCKRCSHEICPCCGNWCDGCFDEERKRLVRSTEWTCPIGSRSSGRSRRRSGGSSLRDALKGNLSEARREALEGMSEGEEG